MTPTARYKQAHLEWYTRNRPLVVAAGHYPGTGIIPDVNTTNGLQRYIVNVMGYLGHQAERVNSMGVPKARMAGKFSLLSGKIEQVQVGIDWRKSGSTTGTGDVHGVFNHPAHPFGIPFKAEVKKGKDRMSKAQYIYERQVTSTGALYVVIKNVDDWWGFYDYVVKL